MNNDVLTIGVIGQMKCGKSTFLNAFVFQDAVLPAASTLMTATLSVITYGEEKKVMDEFVEPLRRQVDDILNNPESKEKRLDEALIRLEELKLRQQTIARQIGQFSVI